MVIIVLEANNRPERALKRRIKWAAHVLYENPEQILMIKKNCATPRVIMCILAAVVAACCAGCLGPAQPIEQSVASPEFHQMTKSYDDRIVFSVIPRSDTPDTYSVDYTILRDGTTVESRSSVVYDYISDTSPIVFEVPRSPESTIALQIEVRNTRGEVLHTSTTTIKSVPDRNGGVVPLYPLPDAADKNV